MNPPAAGTRAPVLRGWLPAIALAGLGIAVYSASLGGVFLFDDTASIVDNASLRHLWPLGAPLSPPQGGLTVSGRPVLNLTLALNYAAGGLDVRGYHAVNLLVHVLASLALFGIVCRTLQAWMPRFESPVAVSWAVAALWAVHPLQTESVAYVVQRAESLMGLLYLATLYAFIRGAGGGARRRAWFALSVACCFLGMATKEVMVSAPLVVFLFDAVFLSESWAEPWRRRGWVHAALASGWILLALLVIGAHGRGGTAGFHGGPYALRYWASQGPAILHYLGLVVWPHPLVIDYGLQGLEPSLGQIPAGLAVLALAGASTWGLVRRSAAGFLGFFFFAILAPTSLVPGGRQALAEHRMYLALAPVLIGIVAGAWTVGRARPRALALLLGAAILALGLLTWSRTLDYRTELALWTDLASLRPGDAEALHGLGAAYYHAGRLQEAKTTLEKAAPDGVDPQINYTLGRVCADLGLVDEAQAQYSRALEIRPGYPDAEVAWGNLLQARGRPADAAAHYRRALAAEPDNAGIRNDLGAALRRMGRIKEAIAEFRKALELDPELAPAHHNLGTGLAAGGRIEEALPELSKAASLNPEDFETQYDYGVALAAAGRWDEAISRYRDAVRLAPSNPAPRNNLGAALAREGRFSEAVSEFRAAVALEPGNAGYHRNLAQALDGAGLAVEARSEFAEADRIDGSR